MKHTSLQYLGALLGTITACLWLLFVLLFLALGSPVGL
jgi:hypothetical protein